MKRARSAWLYPLAVVALVAPVIVGCSSSSKSTTATSAPASSATAPGSGSTTSGPSTTAGRGSSTTGGMATTTTASSVGKCTVADLSAAVRPAGAAAGHWFDVVTLTNKSSRSCTVYGYAGFGFLGANHQPLPSTVKRGSTMAVPDPGPHLVTLKPGDAAWASLAGEDVPVGTETACVSPSFLLITPPDETHQLTVPFQAQACGRGTLTTTALQAGTGPAQG